MDETTLIQALERACSDDEIIFQVLPEPPYLYVYINRVTETLPDYDLLTRQIYTTVAGQSLPEFTGLGIFSRPCDASDPDWHTFLELTPAIAAIPSEPEPLEVEQPQALEPAAPGLAPVAPEPAPEADPEPTPAKTMAEYCFTRNKALLTAKVLPPSTEIAKLVKFFHGQSPESQAELLPVLEIFLKTPKPELAEPFSPEIQNWLQQLADLKDMDARNAAIWLSRYCLNPEETIIELTEVLAPKPAPAQSTPARPASGSASAPNARPYTGQSANVLNQVAQQIQETPEPTSGSFKGGKLSPQLLLSLAVGWFIFTLMTIALGVQSLNPDKVINEACQKSPNIEYCRLAVQMTGAFTFKENVPSERFALNPEEQVEAQKVCMVVGRSIGADDHGVPKAATGVEVLPGFFLADIQQDHPSKPGTLLRTACTFAKTSAEEEPNLLTFEEIPLNWPTTAFKSSHPVDPEGFRHALGVFDVLITFGAGTLFTALGLFVAAYFGLGISVDSFEALFKAALCLGIIEAVAQFIPRFGLFGWLALQSLSLGVTSAFVPGFRVNWADGYRVVAFGAGVINIIRLLLNLLLFVTLIGWVFRAS